MSKNQDGFGTTIIVVLVVWFFVMLAVGFFVFSKKDSGAVGSFQECIDSPGSVLLETYPEQCVIGEQRFNNPNQKLTD